MFTTMLLGKLPVPGRPTIWITVGRGPTALAVGAGGGCLDVFTLICPFFPLSRSLWETARYRLKYCLKGPLNPKPTNQPNPMVQELWYHPYFLRHALIVIHRRRKRGGGRGARPPNNLRGGPTYPLAPPPPIIHPPFPSISM